MMQESQKELDRLTATVDRLGHELERLNSEILYWKSETDKRKQQLGEYLLDDPCDPGDDSLWQQLVAREVEEAREKMGGGGSFNSLRVRAFSACAEGRFCHPKFS